MAPFKLWIKGALRSFGEKNCNQRSLFLCLNKLNKHSVCFNDWMNWINKLTLKNNTVSYCFTLFIYGGPCHLSTNKFLRLYFPLWTAGLFSHSRIWIFLSLYCYLIIIVNGSEFLLQKKLHTGPLMQVKITTTYHFFFNIKKNKG